MCGIIGYVPISVERPGTEALHAFHRLFEQSRVRGHHAYGLAHASGTDINVVKSSTPEDIMAAFLPGLVTVAHTRYSTSGDYRNPDNNQPIVVDDMALAMNGVIHMGTKAEFEQAFDLECATENDAELFLQYIRHSSDEDVMLAGAKEFITSIDGSFSGVWLWGGKLYAATNGRRPLWTTFAYGARWFASTKDIFGRAGFRVCVVKESGQVLYDLQPVQPGKIWRQENV